MSPLALAWRGLLRQPTRSLLGILGIAIVGALLFDMLLLSRGLSVSFLHLLDEVGFDLRVTANRSFPVPGPRIDNAPAVLQTVRALPQVEEAAAVRFGRAEVSPEDDEPFRINFLGVGGPARNTWTLLEGSELREARSDERPAILVNRVMAETLNLRPGGSLRLRGACDSRGATLPTVDFEVAGIVEFVFEDTAEHTAVTTLPSLLRTCASPDRDSVDFLFAASTPEAGPEAAVTAIRQALPDLHSFSNQEFVDRFQATDFSYFRQISFALATITLLFAFLLVATLLTVSVNQRLGEVAALRALGFRRVRVVADLLWESTLLMATGGLLALPLGGLLAVWLDAILRSMPGMPDKLHFFVFQPRALLLYLALLALTGLLASLYPVYLVGRLPIANTLRREVVS